MASVPSSKLRIPPPLPGTVARPGLEALLDRAPAEALTLITAPPGFGKTVLLADWARHRQVSWLSLDEDDAPGRFWPAAVAALAARPRATGSDEHLPGLVARWAGRVWGPGDDVELLTDLLDVDARPPMPLELVLDRIEHVHDRQILDGLRLLLRTPQSSVRLVLAGRVEPALPIARALSPCAAPATPTGS